jgi:hypothetical protein
MTGSVLSLSLDVNPRPRTRRMPIASTNSVLTT